MVLLNAVYFKGLWKHKFNKESTENKPFHVNKTTTIQVPTMKIKKKFYFQELPEVDAQWVALPYEVGILLLLLLSINSFTNETNSMTKITF